jgi:hypothetical protein
MIVLWNTIYMDRRREPSHVLVLEFRAIRGLHPF